MNSANLNVAGSKMSAMLCCSGEKESAMGRDLKSAQNTPSRQPLQPPYTMATGQFNPSQPHHQPPFNSQPFRPQQPPGQPGQPGLPGGPAGGGMFNPPRPGMQPPPMPPNSHPMGMNHYGPPGQHMSGPGGGPKEDYRKVCQRLASNTSAIDFLCQVFAIVH